MNKDLFNPMNLNVKIERQAKLLTKLKICASPVPPSKINPPHNPQFL